MPSTDTPRQSTGSTGRHRSTLSLQKTEIIINVYDLLPAGRVSSMLWALGTSFLHSGVVINGREYAYGGHNKPGVSGVFWSKPKTPPPGGSFRCELLHGFTLATEDEINITLQAASAQFLGTDHNLLSKNCNHFTAHVCKALTGDPGPNWLNRAASIGKALPCLVPRDWLETPDYTAVDGELLEPDIGDDDDESDEVTERSRMLQKGFSRSKGIGSNKDSASSSRKDIASIPGT